MQLTLTMVTGDGQVKELPPMRLPITIGRAEDCKLRIPSPAVSRHHCELIEDDDELIVRDLKSSNGTFVNKERVSKPRELVPGDLLAVGAVVFVVRIDGHPKAVDPIIAYANGAVSPGEAPSGPVSDGVPTWSGAKPSGGSPAGAGGGAVAKPAAGPSPAPASKPAPAGKPKGEESFESLLADLSESDFDIDLPDDDDPPPPKPGGAKPAPGKPPGKK